MNKATRRMLGILAIVSVTIGTTQFASAQRAPANGTDGYPSRPIRLIVPFAPSGPNDLLARYVGEKLAQSTGQQVVIDNRPGGGTVIGTDIASKAAPDGYTLLMVSVSTAVNPTLKKKLPYDTLQDFAPVIRLAVSPNILVVNPAVPAKSVKDLIVLAQAKPGEIAYASGGSGTATHLAGELLCIMAGVKMIHVPYKGAGPATIDLLGGRVSWMFGTILPTLPHIRSGKLRAIGISGTQRSSVLPHIPTVAETLPGFEATSFYGIFAPAGVSKPIVDKLNAEIARIVKSPETRDYLTKQGMDVIGDSPEQFAMYFRAEVKKWAKVIKEAGIESQ